MYRIHVARGYSLDIAVENMEGEVAAMEAEGWIPGSAFAVIVERHSDWETTYTILQPLIKRDQAGGGNAPS